MQPYMLPIFGRPLCSFLHQLHKEPAHDRRIRLTCERGIIKPAHDPSPVPGLFLYFSYRSDAWVLARFYMPLGQYPLRAIAAGVKGGAKLDQYGGVKVDQLSR